MTKNHRWNPADYAKHSQGQERWAKELLSLVSLSSQDHVLDLGCGDGRITAEITGLVPHGRVVGADRSEEMIAFAAQHFPRATYPNLAIQVADASSLPFHEEFDVVFSNAALHWVREHRPVLAGISKALKPGGRCVLQMGGKGNGAGVIRAFDSSITEAPWRLSPNNFEFPYGFHAPQEYCEWMQDAGLIPDSVELIEKDMVHESREAFKGWLRTAWLPYVERVPAESRSEFLETVTSLYLEENPVDEQGRVHVQMIRLQVLAHKVKHLAA
ncbi:MAG: methyltransferase [Acidobacteriaceae bacterium]|nr:methyltransferase [Acidobacteriaceae bacterium]